MNEKLEILLKEIALLKVTREGIDDLLADRYKEVEALLSSSGVTKFSIGEGKSGVTARIKTTSKMELVSPDGLLASITDPLQFARVILDTVTMPHKVVHALKDLGVDISVFKKKLGKSFLEVTVGKESETRMAIRKVKREYLLELEELRKALSTVVVKEGVKHFMESPVLPERNWD